MDNHKRYNKVFMECFSINEELLTDELNMRTVKGWDSVAQIQLITALEAEFDIMMDPEDIVDLTSYPMGKEILKKYNITFS